MLTYVAGLARTGPSTASILSTFEPVVCTTLAAITRHELLTPVQLLGGLLVLSSVGVVQARTRPRDTTLLHERATALPQTLRTVS